MNSDANKVENTFDLDLLLCAVARWTELLFSTAPDYTHDVQTPAWSLMTELNTASKMRDRSCGVVTSALQSL